MLVASKNSLDYWMSVMTHLRIRYEWVEAQLPGSVLALADDLNNGEELAMAALAVRVCMVQRYRRLSGCSSQTAWWDGSLRCLRRGIGCQCFVSPNILF